MNKTIEINPSLFAVNSSSKYKTLKQRDKKYKPLINPSVLKNKFLKRIKQHKFNEIKNSINDKNDNGIVDTKIKDNDNSLFTDEFNQSIEYLQQLSQERKKNIDNKIKKDNLERKTVKNYSSVYTNPSINQTNINIDLPDELKPINNIHSQPYLINNTNNDIIPIKINSSLKEPTNTNINSNNNNLSNNNTIALIKNDVPYGILKGGNKPTYRIWNKTLKNDF
jgi:hypothetical protein